MNDCCKTTTIACVPEALTTEERARSRALRATIDANADKAIELDNGYTFRLRRGDQLFGDLAEWMILERRCCPFLVFDIRWESGANQAPRLTISGPPGTKEFLRAELPSLD